MQRTVIGAVLSFAVVLSGCDSSEKPLTQDALASQIRTTVSLTAEVREFCSLMRAGKIRDEFPGQHLQDVSKQLQKTSQELEKLEAHPAQVQAKESLVRSQRELHQMLAQLSHDHGRNDQTACDRLQEIEQRARGEKAQ